MEGFRDVIALWASPSEMARDVGVSAQAANHWKHRDRIPPEYWTRVIAAAQAKGAVVTAEDFARFAALEVSNVA